MPELYARERKSNASKQFAYNKLKNDRNPTSPKSKPLRPPQPKVVNVDAEKETMLIDLSPNESCPPSMNSGRQIAMSQSNVSNISILDAPIDVPTENNLDIAEFPTSIDSFTGSSSSGISKMEPPPYHAPPMYMNTVNINTNQTSDEDLFDTPYICASSISEFSLQNNITTAASNKFAVADSNKSKSMTNQLDALVMNTIASMSPHGSTKNLSTLTKTDVKPSNNSMSHWQTSDQLNVSQESNTTAATLGSSQNSSFLSTTNDEDSLSDSMKINLSTLTLDDSLKNSFTSTTKRLDKAFYAELEKEIYKNELTAANVLANTSYAVQCSDKENTVSAIPSEIYGRTSSSSNASANMPDLTAVNLNKVQNFKPGSFKYSNTLTKSINQESNNTSVASAIRAHHYESSTNFAGASSTGAPSKFSPIPYQQYHQKQNNVDSNSSAAAAALYDTNAVVNQIWFDQQLQPSKFNSPQKSMPLYGIVGNVNSNSSQYGNVGSIGSGGGADKNHGFIAIANRPPISNLIQNDVRAEHLPNVYSTVAGDIYGSIAGDRYESINNSSASASVFGNVSSARNSNAYSVDSSQAPVIYDEVATEELLRPHRPAPLAPPMLSAQQIQRRLEKERRSVNAGNSNRQFFGNLSANQAIYGNVGDSATGTSLIEGQKVATLIDEIGTDDNPTQAEAIDALRAVNWNHALAVRQFKIERLLR